MSRSCPWPSIVVSLAAAGGAAHADSIDDAVAAQVLKHRIAGLSHPK